METRAFQMADTPITATAQLYDRCPDAQCHGFCCG